MRQLRCELSSGFVHATQRGLGRQALFEDDDDKRHYLDTLKRMMGEYDAPILLNAHVKPRSSAHKRARWVR